MNCRKELYKYGRGQHPVIAKKKTTLRKGRDHVKYGMNNLGYRRGREEEGFQR